jgi:hypothetical protein
VSAQQLLARLVDELPAPERAEPFAFLEDERLPPRITLVEPTAFVLEYVQAAWSPYGPQNRSRATRMPLRRPPGSDGT